MAAARCWVQSVASRLRHLLQPVLPLALFFPPLFGRLTPFSVQSHNCLLLVVQYGAYWSYRPGALSPAKGGLADGRATAAKVTSSRAPNLRMSPHVISTSLAVSTLSHIRFLSLASNPLTILPPLPSFRNNETRPLPTPPTPPYLLLFCFQIFHSPSTCINFFQHFPDLSILLSNIRSNGQQGVSFSPPFSRTRRETCLTTSSRGARQT